MKNKRNLNTKWLLLQNDQNADTTLLHSHDDLCLIVVCKWYIFVLPSAASAFIMAQRLEQY